MIDIWATLLTIGYFLPLIILNEAFTVMDVTGEFQTFTGTLAFSHDPEKSIIQVPGVENFQ